MFVCSRLHLSRQPATQVASWELLLQAAPDCKIRASPVWLLRSRAGVGRFHFQRAGVPGIPERSPFPHRCGICVPQTGSGSIVTDVLTGGSSCSCNCRPFVFLQIVAAIIWRRPASQWRRSERASGRPPGVPRRNVAASVFFFSGGPHGAQGSKPFRPTLQTTRHGPCSVLGGWPLDSRRSTVLRAQQCRRLGAALGFQVFNHSVMHRADTRSLAFGHKRSTARPPQSSNESPLCEACR